MIVLLIMIIGSVACSDITNMSDEVLKKQIIRLDGPGAKIITGDSPEPLWIVNDDTVSKAFIMRLKPKYIASISVTKPDSAQIMSAKKDKNGIVKIQVRDKAFSDLKPVTGDSVKQQNKR